MRLLDAWRELRGKRLLRTYMVTLKDEHAYAVYCSMARTNKQSVEEFLNRYLEVAASQIPAPKV